VIRFSIRPHQWLPVFLAALVVSCGKSPPVETSGEEHTETTEIAAEAFAEAPAPEPAEPVFVHDKSPQVSILLYHEFSASGNATDMVIPTSVFREQMQRIKDSGHAVISMDDFLAWKRGEKNIPDPSFMITMDDGWRSVYTDAYPILKEFGFPFTIYLYTNYVASGSKSLGIEMIKEMMANGASIGCHSRSHPYPPAVRAAVAKGPEAAAEFFRREMVEPADKLESLLGVRPKTYAYPGGFHLPDMAPFAEEAKYEALFTVNPAKVTWETPLGTVHRYVVYGNAPSTFASATSFSGIPLGRRLLGPDGQELQLAVAPADGATITERQPEITADLTPIPDLDPATVFMRVTGLGRVDATFDPETKRLSYRIPVRLRHPETSIFLYWKRLNEKEYDAPMVWSFKLDRRASLLAEIPPPPPDAKAPPPVNSAFGTPSVPPKSEKEG
jgi:peptidoglycan/xylan/chitin deacetylase (PgdA/CDA1 family)